MWENLAEMRTAENIKMHEEWIEKYGKVIKYKGFFNVSSPTCLLEFANPTVDRLYTTDLRALNHILTHSADYQKSELSRYILEKMLGNGPLFVIIRRSPLCGSTQRICHKIFLPHFQDESSDIHDRARLRVQYGHFG